MATATQSTTLMAAAVNAKSFPQGIISQSFSYNTGAVTASGATLFQLCKIPVGATIVDLNILASSGAATNPADVGITGNGLLGNSTTVVAGTASTFVAAGTGGALARATKGLPWRVSISDDATVRFVTLTATVTPGTATVSCQLDGTVFYTLDE